MPTQALQGLGRLLRAHLAQTLLRPTGRAGVAGTAIRHRDQQQFAAQRGQALQQAAAAEHFIIRMGRDYHGAATIRHQLRHIDLGQAGDPG